MGYQRLINLLHQTFVELFSDLWFPSLRRNGVRIHVTPMITLPNLCERIDASSKLGLEV